MTDRYHSLTVTLEGDMRDDDAQQIIQSIAMIRGVLSVKPHVANITSHMAEERVRNELGQKILKVIYPSAYKSCSSFLTWCRHHKLT